MKNLFYRLKGSLLLRAFSLITIPIILIQVIGIIVFYELHWDQVLKKLTNNIASELNFIKDSYPNPNSIPKNILDKFELDVINKHDAVLKKEIESNLIKKRFEQILGADSVGEYGNYYLIEFYDTKIGYNFLIPKDRLQTQTIFGYFLWVLFCSILLSLISYFFIKNQIRPLKRLGIISRTFGRGVAVSDMRPTGSIEIRGLIRDFNTMKNSIDETFNNQRMMLAGISHDLKTPLTRIKLQSEFTDQKTKSSINRNIDEMNTMIDHYLQFIKNEKNEQPEFINTKDFIKENFSSEKNIIILKNTSKKISIKKNQIKRVLINLIDNGLKNGEDIYLSSFVQKQEWKIVIEDNGPGTHLSEKEMLQPFKKGDESLNQGTGLGLSIVKKIVDLNNGSLKINRSAKYGGLKVSISLKV